MLFKNFFINRVRIITRVSKRNHTYHEFLETDANTPVVDGCSVAFAHNDLRGHLVRGAYNRLSASLHYGGSAEVNQLHVACVIHHHVFRLDVSLDYFALMQLGDCTHHAADLELTLLLVQQSNLPNYVEQFLPTYLF